MMTVRQRFPESPPLDIPATIRQALGPALCALKPGAKVAVAVGSRGVSNLRLITSASLAALKAAGARPLIVPAMGSHGGGTPAGQLAVLAQYGITQAALDTPFEPAMEVEQVGTTASGFPVLFSAVALRADAILLINRVKPHTDFSGLLGSGLLKMLVVGLGKGAGAANYHALASRLGYAEVIRDSAAIILRAAPILGGLAIVEDQRHQTARITFVPAAEMPLREGELCAQARALMPGLPFDDIDLLIVDRMGKDISGTGLDPLVIGRSIHGYSLLEDPQRPPPRIRRVFVRELTPASRGNATGLGLADFTTTRLVRAVDWEATNLNALTALSLQGAKVPIHFATDREVLAKALSTLALADPQLAKVVRIADTLSLERLQVSATCLPLLAQSPSLEPLGPLAEMAFGPDDNLLPMD
jgi:hypothetical protein